MLWLRVKVASYSPLYLCHLKLDRCAIVQSIPWTRESPSYHLRDRRGMNAVMDSVNVGNNEDRPFFSFLRSARHSDIVYHRRGDCGRLACHRLLSVYNCSESLRRTGYIHVGV